MLTEYTSIDSTLDAVAAPLLICQQDRIVFANSAAQTLTGYSNSQLQRLSLAALLPTYEPNTAPQTQSTSGLAGADGRVLQVQIHTALTHYAGSSARLLTLHDVTPTPDSETRYRLIAENMIDVVVVTNEHGKVLSISPAVKDMLGYREEELVNSNSIDLVHPGDTAAVAGAIVHLGTDHKLVRLEMRLRHKSGDYIWVESLVGMVQEHNGAEINNISLVRDIHQRKQAEEKLRANEEQLRLITDHMSDVVSHITPDGKIIYVTPSCYTVLGYTPDEMIGQMGFERIHPDDLATTITKFQIAIQTHKTEFDEVRYRHKDGHYMWVENSARVVYDAQGEITSVIAISRDITQRKQAEERLRASEEQLRLITDHVGDVVSWVTPDGIIVYSSPSCYPLFGYTPDELIGKTGFENIHPDDLASVVARFQDTIQNRTSDMAEYRYLHKDGHYFWIETSAGCVYDANGQVTSLIAISRDITQRKQAEELLRRNEQQLRLITDHMGDVVSEVSPDGRVVYTSPSCLTMFGFQPSEMIGQLAFQYVHPDDLAMAAEKFQSVTVGQKPEVAEYRFLHKDGHYVWVESSGGVVYDEAGQIIALVSTTREITRRKQAEEQLRKSEEQFRLLANNSTDVIAQLGADGLIQYITPSSYAVLGYTPENMVGQRPFDLIHPEDRDYVIDKFNGVVEGLSAYFIEFRVRHAKGHYIWLELNTRVLYKSPGVVDYLILAMRDVSVRKKTEEALRASEEQYRLLADSSTDMIGLHELDGICVYASPSIERQTGWSVQEVVGRAAQQHIHPHDMERVFQQLTEAFQVGRDATVEYRFQCKDGSYIWVESHNRLTFRPDGTPHRVVATTRNITARKQAETALKENEERLRLIADNMSDVIVQISPGGIVRYVSPSSRDVLGYEPHELMNEPTLLRIHPEDQPMVALKFQSAYVTRKPETMEVRYRHKNGNYVWMELSGVVVVADADRLKGLVISLRNIEARKRDADALRDSEERLRLITDHIHDMVSLTDADLNFRYVSPSNFDVLGYTQEELIGKSIFDLVHPDDLDLVMQKSLNSMERRQPETVECRYRHKDGYFIWIEANGRVVTDDNNNITGAVITARDISERRWMQRALVEHERLQVALQKQQELNSLKNRMMSRLSHELRTPLAVISTSSDLLEHYAGRMTEEQRRDRMHQIRHQIKHFTNMLDNMSLVVKGSNYNGEFAPTPCDLEKVCYAVIQEVKDTLHANHVVELNLQGKLKAVNSDEKLMHLILTHLLSNALKFSPAQTAIALDLSVSQSVILLTVRDLGIGIPPEDREHIFDPFFRAGNIGEVPGLGIGLSIVKDAILSVRGSIEVESEAGRGTQVTVRIPLGQETATPEDALSKDINGVG